MAKPKKDPKARAQEVFEQDEFLKGVLEAIPADKREQALARLGDHVLRHDEFSRLSDEAREAEAESQAYREKLNEWYGVNLAAINDGAAARQRVKELEAHLSQLSDTPNGDDGNPNTPAPSGLSKAQIEQMLSEREQNTYKQGLDMMANIQNLSFKHFKTFGEPLNMYEVYQIAGKKRLPIDKAYEEMTRSRYEEVAKEQEKERETKLYKQIEDKVLADLASKGGAQLPYDASPSEPVDALRGLTGKKFSNDEALAEFYQSKR